MALTINGDASDLPTPMVVADLVREITSRTDGAGVAVAKNGHVVKKSQWNTIFVDDGDEIEILSAVAGG